MKHVCGVFFLFASAAIILLPRSAVGAEGDVGVDLASAYVFRGATVNDGLVFQPHLEVGGEGIGSGFSAGVWGNVDIDESESFDGRDFEFSEIDIYGSYEVPVEVSDISLSLGYTEYTYPVSEVDSDRELNAILKWDTVLSPGLGLYYGVDGSIDEQLYIEATLDCGFSPIDDVSVHFGALGAWIDRNGESNGEDGLSHAALTADVGYSLFKLSLTYIFELDSGVTDVGRNLVGTLGVSTSF